VNYLEDKKKYEGELNEINKRLQALDDEKSRLIRVGVRIEGALAYINGALADQAEAAKKAAAPAPEAPAAAPAEPAAA
jgi:hypothetical protein